MRGAQLRHHAQQTARELALHTPVRPDVCNKCAEPRSTCAPAVCARPSRRPAPLAVHPSDSGRAREHYSERATDTCRSPALQAVPRPRLLRSVPWFPAYACARGTQSPGVSSAHWHGRTPGSEYRPMHTRRQAAAHAQGPAPCGASLTAGAPIHFAPHSASRAALLPRDTCSPLAHRPGPRSDGESVLRSVPKFP